MIWRGRPRALGTQMRPRWCRSRSTTACAGVTSGCPAAQPTSDGGRERRTANLGAAQCVHLSGESARPNGNLALRFLYRPNPFGTQCE
jgi:hypothetical protein